MPLVISVFAESWGTAGTTTCRISGYSVRLTRGLLPVQFVNANSGYTGMWLATRKSTLLTGLYRYETIRCGGGQGAAHNSRGWGKLMSPARSYLGWEGGLHGDLPRGTLGFGVVG